MLLVRMFLKADLSRSPDTIVSRSIQLIKMAIAHPLYQLEKRLVKQAVLDIVKSGLRKLLGKRCRFQLQLVNKIPHVP